MERSENRSQDVLIPKIIRYLEQDLAGTVLASEQEKKDRQTAIDYFKQSDGECVGLSVLWAYGRRIDDDPQKSSEPTDDIHFFNAMYLALIRWDGETPFNVQQRSDIDRFINHLIFYQKQSLNFARGLARSRFNLLDLSSILEDTKRGSPLSLLEKQVVLSQEMLASRLEPLLETPSDMVFLAHAKRFKGHQMAAYRHSNGHIYFYDPNSETGELSVENTTQLASAFWNATAHHSLGSVLTNNVREITLNIYRFTNNPEANQYKALNASFFTPTQDEAIALLKKDRFLLHSTSDITKEKSRDSIDWFLLKIKDQLGTATIQTLEQEPPPKKPLEQLMTDIECFVRQHEENLKQDNLTAAQEMAERVLRLAPQIEYDKNHVLKVLRLPLLDPIGFVQELLKNLNEYDDKYLPPTEETLEFFNQVKKNHPTNIVPLLKILFTHFEYNPRTNFLSDRQNNPKYHAIIALIQEHFPEKCKGLPPPQPLSFRTPSESSLSSSDTSTPQEAIHKQRPHT